MTPFGRIRRRFGRDTEGAALTEFGLILVPLCVVLLGAFDLGYESYARSVLQGVVNQTARMAAVEDPQFTAAGNTLDERIQNTIKDRMSHHSGDTPTWNFEQTSYYDFSSIGSAERLITDVNGNGQYDNGDCWQDYNRNGTYDQNPGRSGRGTADDVIFYRVTLQRPRIVPVMGLIGVPDQYTISAQAAFRTQPFDDRNPPPTVCTASGGSSSTSSSSSSSSGNNGSSGNNNGSSGNGSSSSGSTGSSGSSGSTGSSSNGNCGSSGCNNGSSGNNNGSSGNNNGSSGNASSSTSSSSSSGGGGSGSDDNILCQLFGWFC